MAVTAENVIKELKNKKYAPLYFLQGDEPYYIDLIANYIIDNALKEEEKSFNLMVMYGKDVQMNQILTNARRYPMMAERQVVVVKEAQDIADLGKAEAEKLLENYAVNAVPTTILVFCHKYGTLDGRKSLAKTIDKNALVVTTKKLYDNQLPAWIEEYVKAKGISITPFASQLMADYVGNDLERLKHEIDKILINYKEKVAIDPDIVQKYTGISKEYNVFELQKALSTKDILKANQIINYFAANPKNNPIIPVIAILFSFYCKLLLIHHTADRSERNIASVTKIHPFIVKEYMVAFRNYPLGKVVENIHALKIADMQTKGVDSTLEDGEILKELIYKLLH